jgi:hypothetical protein
LVKIYLKFKNIPIIKPVKIDPLNDPFKVGLDGVSVVMYFSIIYQKKDH